MCPATPGVPAQCLRFAFCILHYGEVMNTRAEEQIRADIVEVGRRLYARGYVASNDGNISARLDDTRLITTPKSVSKGFMTPDMMVVVDYEGKKVAGERDASSELPMHLEIYRNRPDVNGVVHAHPPTGDRLRRRRHSADARRARRGDHHARKHSDCGVRHAVHRGATGSRAQVHQGARRHAARQPRRGDLRAERDDRLLQDGNDRALRQDQPGRAAARPRAPDLARGSRAAAGTARLLRHRGAGAALHRSGRGRDCDQALCQVLEAPSSPTERLVPDAVRTRCDGRAETGKFG